MEGGRLSRTAAQHKRNLESVVLLLSFLFQWHNIFKMAQEENWLPLAQYSQKYNISVSTLRRYIKKAKVEYRLVENRYLIRDQSPANGSAGNSFDGQAVAQSLKEVLGFCTGLIEEKEKRFKEIIFEKTREILSLKERVSEQKMLIQILEEKLKHSSAQHPPYSNT